MSSLLQTALRRDPPPESPTISCETPPPSVVPTPDTRSRHNLRVHVVGSRSRSLSRVGSQSSARSRHSESAQTHQEKRTSGTGQDFQSQGEGGPSTSQEPSSRKATSHSARKGEKATENNLNSANSNFPLCWDVIRSIRRFKPVMVLENSGSVARDHLASERTFLAYVRTSLALSSAGVALVQLFTIADFTSRGSNTPVSSGSRRVQRFARPLGVATILLALITLVIGVYRYFLVQCALPKKQFPVARFSALFISFVLGALVVVIFSALLDGIGA